MAGAGAGPSRPSARARRRSATAAAPRPTGIVCRCWARPSTTSHGAWDRGFTRARAAQASQPEPASAHARAASACRTCASWIAARTGVAPEPFTARPAARQITLAEAAADGYIDAFRRTPLHDEHLALGARMDRFGGWWRPWHYGDPSPSTGPSARASRSATSARSASWSCRGPDVVELLERLYPCHVADIKPGRSRYALLLNERGHVIDDGMICRETDTRFVLTFTSGGAANAEMWVRDWIETWGLHVHVLDRTMSLAAINVTGPLAETAARRVPVSPTRPEFLGHVHADVAGVPCHVMRLSFTGEAVVRAAPRGRSLGRAVAGAHGRRRAISASGRTACRRCSGCGSRRATSSSAWTPSSTRTPRRLGMDWAVRMDKPRVHRPSVARADRQAARPPPLARLHDGRPGADRGQRRSGRAARSSATSTAQLVTRRCSGTALMLGWLRRTPFPEHVRDRRPRRGRDADPVLRPGGPPCSRLSRCAALRVVADPAALDAARWAGARRDGPAVRARRRVRDRRATGVDRRRRARHRRAGDRLRRVRGSPLELHVARARRVAASGPSARRSPRVPSPGVPGQGLAAGRDRATPAAIPSLC